MVSLQNVQQAQKTYEQNPTPGNYAIYKQLVEKYNQSIETEKIQHQREYVKDIPREVKQAGAMAVNEYTNIGKQLANKNITEEQAQKQLHQLYTKYPSTKQYLEQKQAEFQRKFDKMSEYDKIAFFVKNPDSIDTLPDQRAKDELRASIHYGKALIDRAIDGNITATGEIAVGAALQELGAGLQLQSGGGEYTVIKKYLEEYNKAKRRGDTARMEEYRQNMEVRAIKERLAQTDALRYIVSMPAFQFAITYGITRGLLKLPAGPATKAGTPIGTMAKRAISYTGISLTGYGAAQAALRGQLPQYGRKMLPAVAGAAYGTALYKPPGGNIKVVADTTRATPIFNPKTGQVKAFKFPYSAQRYGLFGKTYGYKMTGTGYVYATKQMPYQPSYVTSPPSKPYTPPGVAHTPLTIYDKYPILGKPDAVTTQYLNKLFITPRESTAWQPYTPIPKEFALSEPLPKPVLYVKPGKLIIWEPELKFIEPLESGQLPGLEVQIIMKPKIVTVKDLYKQGVLSEPKGPATTGGTGKQQYKLITKQITEQKQVTKQLQKTIVKAQQQAQKLETILRQKQVPKQISRQRYILTAKQQQRLLQRYIQVLIQQKQQEQAKLQRMKQRRAMMMSQLKMQQQRQTKAQRRRFREPQMYVYTFGKPKAKTPRKKEKYVAPPVSIAQYRYKPPKTKIKKPFPMFEEEKKKKKTKFKKTSTTKLKYREREFKIKPFKFKGAKL